MARARNIKPAFFDNEDLSELDPFARLLFIGLWTLADREGRLEDRPKRIRAQIFPYDNCDVSQLIDGLSEYDFLKRYSAGGKKCIQITNWSKHQNPHHKEVASILPADKGDENLVCDGYIPLSNTIRNRIYDRDGRICACCSSVENLEIDHIIPVSKGGNSVDDNLQVLCKRCNVKKFDKSMNFKELIKHNSSMIQAWVNNELTLTQEQINEIASCPTDSLNLIPDTFNPITDSLSDKSPKPVTCQIEEVIDGYNSTISNYKPNWSACVKSTLNDKRKKLIREALKTVDGRAKELEEKPVSYLIRLFEAMATDDFLSGHQKSAQYPNGYKRGFDLNLKSDTLIKTIDQFSE